MSFVHRGENVQQKWCPHETFPCLSPGTHRIDQGSSPWWSRLSLALQWSVGVGDPRLCVTSQPQQSVDSVSRRFAKHPESSTGGGSTSTATTKKKIDPKNFFFCTACSMLTCTCRCRRGRAELGRTATGGPNRQPRTSQMLTADLVFSDWPMPLGERDSTEEERDHRKKAKMTSWPLTNLMPYNTINDCGRAERCAEGCSHALFIHDHCFHWIIISLLLIVICVVVVVVVAVVVIVVVASWLNSGVRGAIIWSVMFAQGRIESIRYGMFESAFCMFVLLSELYCTVQYQCLNMEVKRTLQKARID